MKEKKIEVGVDQFTIVLQTTKVKFDFDDWKDAIAEEMLWDFMESSKMLQLFNELDFLKANVKLPEGYTTGYAFLDSAFYFTIAYHEAFQKMGVIVKFSSYAWQEYQKRFDQAYGYPIHLHSFFQLIESDLYDFRLSRIDPCVDFFNYGIDISALKRSIENKRTEVRYGKY
ncbi:hypothetical protein [Enterococcus faecalis]|uniref:hypothetical protein n=1 Tax=Enterococcus TaxID=1350 RepID=UPI002DBBDB56|nr:hypothetical protein [Enterococcus faecalis]MEB6452227.1 hypothetical protein [Enterococcus faecalis]MEB6568145.1 hypothetical protein [Enterococcus faecalis]MEB6582300.1 hypothetical protein [Enterococcus faecalis]MEB8077047.1 hypothetical protein [Enterococcus faecalis]